MGGGNMVDYVADQRWEDEQARRRKESRIREIGEDAYQKEVEKEAHRVSEIKRLDRFVRAKAELKALKKRKKELKKFLKKSNGA